MKLLVVVFSMLVASSALLVFSFKFAMAAAASALVVWFVGGGGGMKHIKALKIGRTFSSDAPMGIEIVIASLEQYHNIINTAKAKKSLRIRAEGNRYEVILHRAYSRFGGEHGPECFLEFWILPS